MGSAIQSTFCEGKENENRLGGKKEGFCEKIEPKDSFNVCTKSSPTFSWNFLKAFSNSLDILADGSNDGAPKFRDCVENIKNNFFQQHKKLHPMIPAKAGNLLINVEQLPRQEIRRPGSDV